MTGIIKSFNLAEWYVIASFSMLMGIACTGILHILIGDPIFERVDWIGIIVMISACALGIISIVQYHKYWR